MISNAVQYIDRERIHGVLGGVDFGGRVFVIARSPAAMLLWLGGEGYSVNGHRSYSESHFTMLTFKGHQPWPEHSWEAHRCYKVVGAHGGRLSRKRVMSIAENIAETFGEEAIDLVLEAVRTNRTVLIDGGGQTPPPQDWRAYRAWRDQHRGGYNPARNDL